MTATPWRRAQDDDDAYFADSDDDMGDYTATSPSSRSPPSWRAAGKDEKRGQISLLVELCAYRADAPLVEETVRGVAGSASTPPPGSFASAPSPWESEQAIVEYDGKRYRIMQ